MRVYHNEESFEKEDDINFNIDLKDFFKKLKNDRLVWIWLISMLIGIAVTIYHITK